MAYDIIFSGFGGQGALFAGQLLAYAAMDAGRFVTWIPSYGPEMRGGTAHCTVVVSEEEIGSPLVRNPSTVIALNNPSAEKYESQLATNGYLFYNSSLVSHPFTRRNIQAIPIAGSEAAAAVGPCQTAQHGDARRDAGACAGAARRRCRAGAGQSHPGAPPRLAGGQQTGPTQGD